MTTRDVEVEIVLRAMIAAYKALSSRSTGYQISIVNPTADVVAYAASRSAWREHQRVTFVHEDGHSDTFEPNGRGVYTFALDGEVITIHCTATARAEAA